MAQMEVKRQQQFTDMLAKAVTAGKLTQDQANKITAKKAELDTAKTSLAGKTAAERSAATKAQADSLTQWLKDNNIPAGYLPFRGAQGQFVIGTVSAVNGSTITITTNQRGSNAAVTYSVDASGAVINKIVKTASQTGAPTQTVIEASGIAVGDKLMVQGTISGTNIVATQIRDGEFGGRGMGSGHGRFGTGGPNK